VPKIKGEKKEKKKRKVSFPNEMGGNRKNRNNRKSIKRRQGINPEGGKKLARVLRKNRTPSRGEKDPSKKTVQD